MASQLLRQDNRRATAQIRKKSKFLCKPCNRFCTSRIALEDDKLGRKHVATVQSLAEGVQKCIACDNQVFDNKQQLLRHLGGRVHRHRIDNQTKCRAAGFLTPARPCSPGSRRRRSVACQPWTRTRTLEIALWWTVTTTWWAARVKSQGGRAIHFVIACPHR